MKSLSAKKKGSLVLGVLILISLFLPWINILNIFSYSLFELSTELPNILSFVDLSFSRQLAIYIGYVFIVLGSAGLYFNYRGDIQKSKISYYLMIAYFVLVGILNVVEGGDGASKGGDGPSIFDILDMGVYIFLSSFIINLFFLSEEKESI